MTLNVGSDFKQRWLSAPEAVRQTFLDDLNRVCDLLKPDTNIEMWQKLDEQAQKQSITRIQQAYVDRKLQLIADARLRKQKQLEQRLEQKRTAQALYAEQLLIDEEQQFKEQNHALMLIRHSLEQQLNTYISRYHKNPDYPAINFSKGMMTDHSHLSERESLRLRLELEAEAHIEHSVAIFREKLQKAAQEEIDYALKNAQHLDEMESTII